MGLAGLHFHDLRHTGNLLAAQTPGATLRDLMGRMGHDSMRAALIYQHPSIDTDRHVAASMAFVCGAGEGNRTPTVSLGS
jgi:integrase